MSKPKHKHNPSRQRTPIAQENPSLYRKHRICWQLGSIDFDCDWSFRDAFYNFKFEISDELLEYLMRDNIPEGLMGHIEQLEGKSFSSVENFIQKFERRYKNELGVYEHRLLLGSINKYYFWEEVLPKMRNFEKLTWEELEKETADRKGRSKHHSIKTHKLISKAEKRLKELSLEDYEEVFSLRLTGELRIFGIREFNYLRILWLDPNHEICPPNMRYT